MSEAYENQSSTGTDGPSAPAPSNAPAVSSNKDPNVKAVVKNVDMADEMQQEAVDIAMAALDKYSVEKDIASYVKRECDRKFGPTWHAVVGKNFGSFVTHETRHFIYFYVGPLAFLLWRS